MLLLKINEELTYNDSKWKITKNDKKNREIEVVDKSNSNKIQTVKYDTMGSKNFVSQINALRGDSLECNIKHKAKIQPYFQNY
jgi:hypothetical protein